MARGPGVSTRRLRPWARQRLLAWTFSQFLYHVSWFQVPGGQVNDRDPDSESSESSDDPADDDRDPDSESQSQVNPHDDDRSLLSLSTSHGPSLRLTVQRLRT